jgi:hypothetical protein
MPELTCVLCNRTPTKVEQAAAQYPVVTCRACGEYTFNSHSGIERNIRALDEDKRRIMRFAVKSFDGGGFLDLNGDTAGHVLGTTKPPSRSDIPRHVLVDVMVHAVPRPFELVRHDLWRFPLFSVDTPDALANVLATLERDGWVVLSDRDADGITVLATPKAWKSWETDPAMPDVSA